VRAFPLREANWQAMQQYKRATIQTAAKIVERIMAII